MEDFLYAYNQPKKFAKYDLILDGKIIADEVVTKSGSIGGGEGNNGLTAEQIELLTAYASAEGRNIPISEDGEIITQVGHTYTITAKELPVKCTDADFNPLCEVAAHKQIAFVATGAAAYVDNVTCTVTEVFKPAAPVKLSGNGGGEPEGDYVTLDANGCITSGRLDTLVDGSYLQYGKGLTMWNIALPSLSNGTKMFDSSAFSKDATILILNSLPAYSTGAEHIIDIGIDYKQKQDAEVNAAISSATEKGWMVNVFWLLASNNLPNGYKRLKYLESNGTQYIDTEYVPNNETGIYLYQLKNNPGDYIPMGCRNNDSSETRFYALRSNVGTSEAYQAGYGWGNWRAYSHLYGLSKTYLNYMNSRQVVGENTRYVEVEPMPFTPECSIFMFAANIGGVANLKWRGRIYEATISQEKSIAMGFVPCLDPEGAPCMFDLVSETPFYNDGTEDFIYPTEETTATYSLRRVLPDWGKLTAHGLKRLYHTPSDYTGELIDYAIENGYKRIVESEKPEDGYWTPKWRETEEEIILDWIESEPPTIDEISE